MEGKKYIIINVWSLDSRELKGYTYLEILTDSGVNNVIIYGSGVVC